MQKTIYSAAYRSLVAELRRARVKLGLRQADVGARLNVSRHWIQKVETNQARLDVRQYAVLCRLYKIDPSRLIRQLGEELSDEDAPFYLLSGDPSDSCFARFGVSVLLDWA